jgi:hypothetical protein
VKKLILFLLLVASCGIASSQEVPKARFVDEFGKICSEDFMARYDNFMINLQNDPTAIGYIIFNGDRKVEGRNLNYIDALTAGYPKGRFDTSRIKFVRAENLDHPQVKFWIVPLGALPPISKEFSPQGFDNTTLYDRNWADFNRNYGPLEIYFNGFAELGCEFAPNVKGFAKTLLDNPELTGYLITYTKFGRGAKRGTRVGQFAVNDLVKNYKVARKRLKLIYGGNRKEPEIELWLVPKGGTPPIPTPEKRTNLR